MCSAATMASVLSARLFVAVLSGSVCNLWTYLYEEAGRGRKWRAAVGKSVQKQILKGWRGGSAMGAWRSGTVLDCGSLIMGWEGGKKGAIVYSAR